jgi:adsorption protein A
VKTQDIKYAELSSYHAKLAKSQNLETTVIGWVIELTPGKAMESDILVSRARSLLNKDISALSLDSVVMVSANAKEVINPVIWQAQNQCSELMLSDSEESLLQRGKALCLQQDHPLEAAALLKDVDDFAQYPDDNRLMAQLLHRGERYEDSVVYWSSVPPEDKSLFDAYAHLESLAKSRMWQDTDDLWRTQSLYLNPNWWLIGITAAEKLDQTNEVRSRAQRAFYVTGNSIFAARLAKRHVENGNHEALEALVDNILEQDNNGNASAQVAYLLVSTHPNYAERLFENAIKFPFYKYDTKLQISYADVLVKQGRVSLAKSRYRLVIDQQTPSSDQQARLRDSQILPDELQTYVQRAHRDLKEGWKLALAGWAGRSDGIGVPGFAGRTGDFFSFANANYYFDEPVVPSLALSLSSLVSGQSESNTTAEWDLSAEAKPFEDWNYFARAGIRNRVVDSDRTNSPYVRVSADVFSNDLWSKTWQALNDKWLYQLLYLDALQYLDGTQNYALYGRYELGQTLKLWEENKYRFTPYAFLQASLSNTGEQHQQDARAGLGASLRWEWLNDPYDGLSVDTEIGLEWQKKIKSNQEQDSADSLLLRYALYY